MIYNLRFSATHFKNGFCIAFSHFIDYILFLTIKNFLNDLEINISYFVLYISKQRHSSAMNIFE